MSFSEVAIKVTNLSKCYEIYNTPRDRLKQMLIPRIKRLFGQRVSQYYREFWALRDVSFELKKGTTIGIIGRNGSGKSTLLQMICGTLNPTSGTVETRGRVAALLELGSGFNPEFTGRENIYMSASVLGLSTSEIDNRFDAIVAFSDIGEFIEQPVKTYSSGMYVRLAFAVIAHVNAEILVIDEALAVGDVFFTQKCMRFLRKFMENGTVLFVSHDTASITSFCTQVVWLQNGKVVMSGMPKDVCAAYLEATYETQHGFIERKALGGNTKTKAVDSKISRDDSVQTQNDNAGAIIEFNPSAHSFGKGGATITQVQLLDDKLKNKPWIVGGESVSLSITAEANMAMDSIIVGFFVKDRLGQMLFGDNTCLKFDDKNISCKPGDAIRAHFDFIMPWLPAGDYAVTISVANGTQVSHEQQHWIHDALIIKSNSTRVCNGLVGIPILNSNLEVGTLPREPNG